MNKFKVAKYINITSFILWLFVLLEILFASNINLKLTCVCAIGLVLMRLAFDISECKVGE